MASRDKPSKTDELPFGTFASEDAPSADEARPRRSRRRTRRSAESSEDDSSSEESASEDGAKETPARSSKRASKKVRHRSRKPAAGEEASEDNSEEPPRKSPSTRKRSTKKRGSVKETPEPVADAEEPASSEADSGGSSWRRNDGKRSSRRTKLRTRSADRGEGGRGSAPRETESRPSNSREESAPVEDDSPKEKRAWATRDGERRSRRAGKAAAASMGAATTREKGGRRGRGPKPNNAPGGPRGGARAERAPKTEVTGLLITDKGGHGKIRVEERGFLADRKEDVHVSPRLIQKFRLREGSILRGRVGRGMGKHKYDLMDVLEVDGAPPKEMANLPEFRRLTSIDPDFHYALGDFTSSTSMRVVDLICPVGRGQRGLIVAPPRSGKTMLMQEIAKGMEEHYPDVELLVLLVDERPEEATEWKRSTKGQVFVSTNDELPKVHVDIAEVVWKRAMRLVEMGRDVVLLLDSITRLARAYNHTHGTSGKTMSGGLDAKAMERPKMIFGSARNTETAGSLTILGTTLIETGSQMDKMIFEEFKGTGNAEIVLSRKLADRRIFPAIDVERSGTRKEEKLMSAQRLRRTTVLRRVLARMNFIEAMELLTTKLDDVEKNDDFLARFDIDPEA